MRLLQKGKLNLRVLCLKCVDKVFILIAVILYEFISPILEDRRLVLRYGDDCSRDCRFTVIVALLPLVPA